MNQSSSSKQANPATEAKNSDGTRSFPAWYSRTSVGNFIYSNRVQYFIIGVILINAVILGLETTELATSEHHWILTLTDRICLTIFVVEILIKLYSDRLAFFKSSWNVFDFLIVGIALLPGAETFAVLRALRALRVLRLISVIPALRRVVTGLIKAVPGLLSVGAVLVIIFYVGAVIATMLFGKDFPAEFGDLSKSLFTLFQVMTLDNWSVIGRLVWEEIAWAPVFFVPFILVSSLTVLNLFIAVIVDAMQSSSDEEDSELDSRPASSASSKSRAKAKSNTSTKSSANSKTTEAEELDDIAKLGGNSATEQTDTLTELALSSGDSSSSQAANVEAQTEISNQLATLSQQIQQLRSELKTLSEKLSE